LGSFGADLAGRVQDIGWQNRSAACVDLDDLIDQVFDGFESMGVLNNTFVIFSSE